MTSSNIKAWANTRETSHEIAEAIFELANNDEVLAQKFGRKATMKCYRSPLLKPKTIICFGVKRRLIARTSD